MRVRSILLLVVSVSLAPSSLSARQPSAAPAQAGADGCRALVVGNNEYRTLPKLRTAEADAREVAAILKDAHGFETALLINATRQQLVSALSGYRRRLGPEASFEHRLPTGAEWGCAARGGTTTSLAFGDKLSAAQANCDDSYPATAAKFPGKTVPVGSLPANGFGLYDVHGNVAGWADAAHHDSCAGAPPVGPAWVGGSTAVFRVARGGSSERDPDLRRSARHRQSALAFDIIGLRVVATPK